MCKAVMGSGGGTCDSRAGADEAEGVDTGPSSLAAPSRRVREYVGHNSAAGSLQGQRGMRDILIELTST